MASSWVARVVSVFSAVVAVIAVTAPGVAAEPLAPGPSGDWTVMPLSDLGSPGGSAFDLTGEDTGLPENSGITTVSFRVPRGLTPVELRGRMEFPVRTQYASLAIRQGNRTISRVVLPPGEQADVVLPLPGVAVAGDSVNVSISMTALPIEGFCWSTSWSTSPSLEDARVLFTGSEQLPTTVGDFLPAVLRKVTIALPAVPSQSESEAAIQLASAVAVYHQQNPEVVVVPLPEGASSAPVPPGPLERQIVVKERAGEGVSLQGGPGSQTLLVSGSGEEISQQARLFNSEWAEFAISAAVAAETLPGEQDALPDTTTLGVTNQTGLSSQGLEPKVVVYIDQTRFGRPLSGIRVHLLGSHTPVPDGLGGELVASVDGQAVDRWTPGSDGVIDRTVEIPARVLKRVTNVSVALLTSANAGGCDDHIRMALRLDPNTSIQVRTSKSFAPQGLQSFPQALSPHVLFGLGRDAFGDTARAAQIAVGLRRASRAPLVAEVTSLREAIESRVSAVLVSGTEAVDNAGVSLPFDENQSLVTVTGVDGKGQSVTLELNPNTPFGVLQVGTDGNRSVLVASSRGAPDRLDELLRWAGGEPGRWTGLDGRAVISVGDEEPLVIPNTPQEYPDPPGSDTLLGEGWLRWALAGVALAAVLGAVALLRRR